MSRKSLSRKLPTGLSRTDGGSRFAATRLASAISRTDSAEYYRGGASSIGFSRPESTDQRGSVTLDAHINAINSNSKGDNANNDASTEDPHKRVANANNNAKKGAKGKAGKKKLAFLLS